jgi:hypothetical protein
MLDEEDAEATKTVKGTGGGDDRRVRVSVSLLVPRPSGRSRPVPRSGQVPIP